MDDRMNVLTLTTSEEDMLTTLERQWPAWLPVSLVSYLAHIEFGVPIRAIGRARACHASTISRQIGRWEQLRDDTLIDEALNGLVKTRRRAAGAAKNEDIYSMTLVKPLSQITPDDETFPNEARRVLRRLSEPGAVLALSGDMEKGVVVRETHSGTTQRTAIVERALAQALAVKEWIVCAAEGRVARYRITNAGRTALNRLLAEAENRASGFAEAASVFEPSGKPCLNRKACYCSGESPLMLLGRRREKDGSLFLEAALVNAGERLREDFELAQMGPKPAPDWAAVIAGGEAAEPAATPAQTPLSAEAASARVAGALRELGPGLGDVALRCCCLLEGLETAERELGWSARSGKIVLRIALNRLAQHYVTVGSSQMIG